MSPNLPDRRRFLKTTGLAPGASALGFPAITRCQSPNSKLGLALIGVGGRGRSHVQAALESKEDIIALVDVNEDHLGSALQQAPKARGLRDFRELFTKMDDIDAVFVSTTRTGSSEKPRSSVRVSAARRSPVPTTTNDGLKKSRTPDPSRRNSGHMAVATVRPSADICSAYGWTTVWTVPGGTVLRTTKV